MVWKLYSGLFGNNGIGDLFCLLLLGICYNKIFVYICIFEYWYLMNMLYLIFINLFLFNKYY